MQKQIIFTKKGYEDKQKEYEALLQSRPEAVKDLAKAREMGDLSENGYYKAARMKLSDIDRHIRQIKYILKLAKVKEVTQSNTVDVGTMVTFTTDGKTYTYEIVGTYEANPRDGKISSSSPLGKLLMEKQKGDTVLLSIGDQNRKYTIIDIQQ